MSELIVDKVTAKIIQSDTYNIANTALNVLNTTQSVSTSTGSITTNGGLGIIGNANIGGNGNIGGSATISGGATISGALTISNNTQSTNTSTGAITTSGGIGILKDANIGGNTTISGYLDINSALASSSTSTGSITTNGGIGILKDANIGGLATIAGTLTVGNFTTGNVSPRSVLHRGLPSVVGRLVGLFIYAGSNFYTSTPLDAGVWEIHLQASANNGGTDEDNLLVYTTIATIAAGKYLTFKLTGVVGTSIATGLQYRLQTFANSTLQSDITQGSWLEVPMDDTVRASTNLLTDPIAGNGIGNGLVGFPPAVGSGVNNNTIIVLGGWAKRVA